MSSSNKSTVHWPVEVPEILDTPQAWADFFQDLEPGDRRRTRWFPDTSAPARVGWYERHFVRFIERQYWNGAQWLDRKGKPVRLRASKFWPCWRGANQPVPGIVEPPKAG